MDCRERDRSKDRPRDRRGNHLGVVVGIVMGIDHGDRYRDRCRDRSRDRRRDRQLLRAYYYPWHLMLLFFAPTAKGYRWHPVAWDDMCSLPFVGLNRFLLAL